VNYEYWTCNTLAPGVDAKGDNGSPTMQVVAPVQTVTRDNAYTGWRVWPPEPEPRACWSEQPEPHLRL